MKELQIIQSKLNAPKGQYNSFGKYRYRSCEDILAAAKPLLSEVQCTLTLSDEMIPVGDRIYVRATATITNAAGKSVSTTAFAREEDAKKGMDASQVTGAASSYARKYALNGLFAIDDVKDSDATNTHGQDKQSPKQTTAQSATAAASQDDIMVQAVASVNAASSVEQVTSLWNQWGTSHPHTVAQGSPFYRAVQAKIAHLRQSA